MIGGGGGKKMEGGRVGSKQRCFCHHVVCVCVVCSVVGEEGDVGGVTTLQGICNSADKNGVGWGAQCDGMC